MGAFDPMQIYIFILLLYRFSYSTMFYYLGFFCLFVLEKLYSDQIINKQIATLSNGSIKISKLCYVVMEITLGYSLLGMIRDRDQRALSINLAREAMQKQGCLNSKKWGELAENWKKNND